MGKKKGGKRMNKKQVSEALQRFFQESPDTTFSFKQIFKSLKLDTHPLKMLAIDIMEEMAWDDFLTKVTESSYKLNTKTQLQEGIFRRKANRKNSFIPDDGSHHGLLDMLLSACHVSHLHLVAVESPKRVALCHKDRLTTVVGYETVFAV